jgi:hypothetical protein
MTLLLLACYHCLTLPVVKWILMKKWRIFEGGARKKRTIEESFLCDESAIKGGAMNRIIRNLSILIIVFGAVALIMGITFIYEGASKYIFLTSIMKQENIKLSDLGVTGNNANKIIDSQETAQIAGDTVRGHRHSIAPSYTALLGGEKFDPTNPKDLTYAQAQNLENYLYLAVLSFGVTTIAMATGGFMIVVALALGATGFILFRLAQMLS